MESAIRVARRSSTSSGALTPMTARERSSIDASENFLAKLDAALAARARQAR